MPTRWHDLFVTYINHVISTVVHTDYKRKCATQICEAFLQRNCKYGEKCFRIHPAKHAAHFTGLIEPEVKPEVNEEDDMSNLFH